MRPPPTGALVRPASDVRVWCAPPADHARCARALQMFVRVYADNSQYRTVTVPVTATAQDVLRTIGPKFELSGNLDRFMLYTADDVAPRPGRERSG